MTRAIVALLNPTAGRGRGRRQADAGLDTLRGAGLTVLEIRADSAAAALAMATEAVAAGRCAGLVAVGGDGTLSLAVAAARGSDVPVGLIPSGTGNDFATVLGIPDDPVAAAHIVAAGHTRRIDVAVAVDAAGVEHPFVTVLATGFDAAVNARANALTWPKGSARYTVAALAEMATMTPWRYRMTFDGKPLDTDAALVAVGNGATYGGGMRVCPDADVADGLLDATIVSVGATRTALGAKVKLLGFFPRVFSGSHTRLPEVTTRRAREITLAADRTALAYADGDPIGELPLTVRVEPGAVRCFTPAD